MNPQPSDKTILNANEMNRVLRRMALEIVECSKGTENILLVGIQTRGVNLAQRLAALMGEVEKSSVPLGKLDITLYRDDLRHTPVQPTVRSTDLPPDVTGMVVVLVDDVLFTGRTIRSALDAIVDFGRPSKIMLSVLIDRGHRELPISADVVGRSIQTSSSEEIVVKVREVDGEDGVWITKS